MSMWRPDAAKFLSLAASGALVACTHAPGPITMVKPAAFPVTVAPQVASTDGSVFPTATSGSLYEPRRDWRPGDLVTIDIVTATTANDTDNDSLKPQGHGHRHADQLHGRAAEFRLQPQRHAVLAVDQRQQQPDLCRRRFGRRHQQRHRPGRGGDHPYRPERHARSGRPHQRQPQRQCHQHRRHRLCQPGRYRRQHHHQFQ